MKQTSWVQSVGWGILLWLVGYVLGFALFPFVPTALIGWIITPFGIVLTLLVLMKKIHLKSLQMYAVTGVIWTVIAILGDYFGIVKLLHPADGYYKLDVYLYYSLTFFLPLLVGVLQKKNVLNNTKL